MECIYCGRAKVSAIAACRGKTGRAEREKQFGGRQTVSWVLTVDVTGVHLLCLSRLVIVSAHFICSALFELWSANWDVFFYKDLYRVNEELRHYYWSIWNIFSKVLWKFQCFSENRTLWNNILKNLFNSSSWYIYFRIANEIRWLTILLRKRKFDELFKI